MFHEDCDTESAADDRIADAQSQAAEDDDNNTFDPPLDLVTEIFANDRDREIDAAYRSSWRNHHTNE